MTRREILRSAEHVVCDTRNHEHGEPEDNFKIIANLWSAYMGVEFTPLDVAMLMALLKAGRIKTGVSVKDSFVDLAGYAACGGEISGRMEGQWET